MKKRSARILGAACAVALAALGSLVAPMPSASASTYHHLWSDLSFPASPILVQCVPPRSLELGRGHYRWRTFAVHEAHQGDQGHMKLSTVGVAGGEHTWRTCLTPFRYNGRWVYRVRSILHHRASGVRLYHTALVQRGGWGSGRYHWGATLDRVRKDRAPGPDRRALIRG